MICVKIFTPSKSARNFNMTITVFQKVDPFKKKCRSDDQFKKCRYSSHCIRKEFFCDNRVNCISSNREKAGYDESGVWVCDKRGKNIFLILLAVSKVHRNLRNRPYGFDVY